jgi:hypothetical protein
MSVLETLIRLIERLKPLRIVQIFTIYLRYLIGSAFVFASMPKIMGERFTTMSVDTPVGFYFEAMYRSGFYWNFLGWGQMIPALLLMTQRFAAFGALLYYPVIINIWLVTWSIGFQGTPVVTFLMFLACTYLLVWEYRRILPWFQHEHAVAILPSNFDDRFMRKPIWIALGIFLAGLILAMPANPKYAIWHIGVGFFTALGFGLYHLFTGRVTDGSSNF